jgi:hypothetical protein
MVLEWVPGTVVEVPVGLAAVTDQGWAATAVNPVMVLEWVPGTVVEVPVGLAAVTDQDWAATAVNPVMDLERDQDWVEVPVLAFVQ